MNNNEYKVKFNKKQYLILALTVVVMLCVAAASFLLYLYGQYGDAIFSSEPTRLRKAEEYARAADSTPHGGIVFFGDSIIEMYKLDRYYPDFGYINRGISGDTTLDLLNRVETNVIAIEPKIIVMIVGANDVHKRTPDKIMPTYRELLSKIQTALPDTEVIIQGVLPITERNALMYNAVVNGRTNEKITILNEYIENLANEFGYMYANTGDSLKDHAGRLVNSYSIEGLHLNSDGYIALTAALKPYINAALEILN